MKFGDNKILIERSENLYLAAIFEGNGERLGSRMRKLLKDIDDKYSGVLTDWDGDMTELAGISAVIAALVSKKALKRAGSEGEQTETPLGPGSDEIEEAHLEEEDTGMPDNKEQETVEEVDQEAPSDETVTYECPECYSEISPMDVKCPVCGVEFSETNDTSSASSGDEEQIEKHDLTSEGGENTDGKKEGGDEP